MNNFSKVIQTAAEPSPTRLILSFSSAFRTHETAKNEVAAWMLPLAPTQPFLRDSPVSPTGNKRQRAGPVPQSPHELLGAQRRCWLVKMLRRDYTRELPSFTGVWWLFRRNTSQFYVSSGTNSLLKAKALKRKPCESCLATVARKNSILTGRDLPPYLGRGSHVL